MQRNAGVAERDPPSRQTRMRINPIRNLAGTSIDQTVYAGAMEQLR
jgi:hypothetical protein